jgi:hypothetical protein
MFRSPLVASLAAALLLTGAAQAADISLLSDLSSLRSDFGSPSIPTTDALIYQSGNSDLASINQSLASGGAGNYSEIDQYGSSNQAAASQSGYSDRLRIVQNGSGNIANVTQSGTGNVVDLAQWGDANLTATQVGDYNSVIASQANQNGVPAMLSETGSNNIINLISSTPGIPVSIGITGSGMTVNASY